MLVTGLKQRVAHELLNDVAHHWVHHTGEVVHPGDLRDHADIEVVEVSEPTVHLVFEDLLYGPVMHAHQLVWADDRGR